MVVVPLPMGITLFLDHVSVSPFSILVFSDRSRYSNLFFFVLFIFCHSMCVFFSCSVVSVLPSLPPFLNYFFLWYDIVSGLNVSFYQKGI